MVAAKPFLSNVRSTAKSILVLLKLHLDVIITRETEDFVQEVTVRNPLISVHFKLDIVPPVSVSQEITYRKIADIDLGKWKAAVQSTFSTLPDVLSCDELLSLYNTKLKNLLDIHAPVVRKTLTIKTFSPLISDDIRREICRLRTYERLWRRTGLSVHRQMYKDQRTHVTSLIASAKQSYYNGKIVEGSSNNKTLFRIVDKLLHKEKPLTLPTSLGTSDTLAAKILHFFHDKIIKIRSATDVNNLPQEFHQDDDVLLDIPKIFSFQLVSNDDVEKIIRKAPQKFSALDPVPVCLLTSCLPELLPIIVKIINGSLCSSSVSSSLKDALITPILKKPSLDPEDLKNFRPVSNLPYISKIIERVVAAQLNKHMSENNLYEVFQSAYKKSHSNETALTRVQNDILRSLDEKRCVLLVLLDLSSAFDTVDHTLLLSRLSSCIGVSDTALAWFKSYLSGRYQAVQVNRSTSRKQHLRFGVPQGSVLGPLLFSIYTLPLGQLMRHHSVDFHLFVDDIIYVLGTCCR